MQTLVAACSTFVAGRCIERVLPHIDEKRNHNEFATLMSILRIPAASGALGSGSEQNEVVGVFDFCFGLLLGFVRTSMVLVFSIERDHCSFRFSSFGVCCWYSHVKVRIQISHYF